MQKRLNLSDGSAVDLTVATIINTSGASFDGTGIKPDYEVQPVEGDWTNLDETTDPQLKKAVEVVLAVKKAGETVQAEASSSDQQQESSSAPESSSQPEPPPPSASGPSSQESAPEEELPGESDEESSEETLPPEESEDDAEPAE